MSTNQFRGIRKPGRISETSLALTRATRRGYIGAGIIRVIKACLQNTGVEI